MKEFEVFSSTDRIETLGKYLFSIKLRSCKDSKSNSLFTTKVTLDSFLVKNLIFQKLKSKNYF